MLTIEREHVRFTGHVRTEKLLVYGDWRKIGDILYLQLPTAEESLRLGILPRDFEPGLQGGETLAVPMSQVQAIILRAVEAAHIEARMG
jgi:hypothetical protein